MQPPHQKQSEYRPRSRQTDSRMSASVLQPCHTAEAVPKLTGLSFGGPQVLKAMRHGRRAAWALVPAAVAFPGTCRTNMHAAQEGVSLFAHVCKQTMQNTSSVASEALCGALHTTVHAYLG